MALTNFIVLSSLLFPGFSQSCKYGYFPYDNKENCMFYCDTDNTYIPISELSVDFIKSHCYYMVYPDECNSVDHFVYRNDSCGCPYCRCMNEFVPKITERASYAFSPPVPARTCFNCTCSSPPAYIDGIDDLIYDCQGILSDDIPVEWIDYECPPMTCTSSYETRDSWWEDVVDSDTLCTKLCYCSANEGEICETGFDNIMANDKLLYAFMSECADDRSSRAVNFSILFY